MRRLLTVLATAAAAAAAALVLPGGALPVAEAGRPGAAAGQWSAREAAAFWTEDRMASALPVPGPPGPEHVPDPRAAGPAAPQPVPASAPSPAADPAAPSAPSAAAAPDAPAPPAGPGAEPALPDAPVPPGTDPAAAPAEPAPAVPVAVPAQPAQPVAAALPATTGVGQDFDGIPVVGRMFVMQSGGAYFCTASVVSSPSRDMVLSAAHCLLGTDTRQVAFVPQYTRANPRPYGMFPVLRDTAGHAKVWIAPRYRTDGPDRAATLDVAFAQVGPGSDGLPVEDVVGGNRLVTGATFHHAKVTLIGHPAAASRPRMCVNRTTKFTSRDAKSPGSFLRIDCTGYPGGTSGGPFIARYDTDTQTGDVVGVIGGWKTGGPTADTSYSSYFGAEIRKLYQAAVAGARAR
ncbi:trypsin-like peptidase domain-containing protein [Streptomyces sp. NPDC048352]|uniref:trypsin-like peptidase domain-containing protein n=1 Tax=Streptomyces sp. NPDC048352 TaxID=3154718 RepID=UPI0034249784